MRPKPKYSPEKRRVQYVTNYGNEVLTQARRRARKLKLPCTITKADIDELLIATPYCPILKVKLEIGYTGNNDNAPSLDRKNNKEGYTKGNCWIISRKANVMKSDSTSQERVLFAMYIIKTHLNNLLKYRTEMLELVQTHLLPLLVSGVVSKKAVQLQEALVSCTPDPEPCHSKESDVPFPGSGYLSEMG